MFISIITFTPWSIISIITFAPCLFIPLFISHHVYSLHYLFQIAIYFTKCLLNNLFHTVLIVSDISFTSYFFFPLPFSLHIYWTWNSFTPYLFILVIPYLQNVLANMEDSNDMVPLREKMSSRFAAIFPNRVKFERISTTLQRKKEDVAVRTLQKAWIGFKAKQVCQIITNYICIYSYKLKPNGYKLSIWIEMKSSYMSNFDCSHSKMYDCVFQGALFSLRIYHIVF